MHQFPLSSITSTAGSVYLSERQGETARTAMPAAEKKTRAFASGKISPTNSPKGFSSLRSGAKEPNTAVRTGSSGWLAEKAAAAPSMLSVPLRVQAIIQTVSLFICSSLQGT